jgi:hypothetical protein
MIVFIQIIDVLKNRVKNKLKWIAKEVALRRFADNIFPNIHATKIVFISQNENDPGHTGKKY